MRANPCAGVVGSHVGVYSRSATFHNRRYEFLNQVWMRSSVACTLKESNVVRIINFFALSEVLDFLNQQIIRIRHINPAGILTPIENNVAFILKLLPFERHFCSIYIVAFAVLTNHIKK